MHLARLLTEKLAKLMTRPTYIDTQIDMITNAADVITKFIILCFAFLPFAIIKLLSAHFVFLSI